MCQVVDASCYDCAAIGKETEEARKGIMDENAHYLRGVCCLTFTARTKWRNSHLAESGRGVSLLARWTAHPRSLVQEHQHSAG